MDMTVNQIYCFCANIDENTTLKIRKPGEIHPFFIGSWDDMPAYIGEASVSFFKINKDNTVTISLEELED